MPSPAEIAYRESVRSLEGQAQDLESIRSHVNLVLSAGGITAAFFGTQADGKGFAFWLGVIAFAAIAATTVWAYWPIEFAWDFDGYKMINAYVDAEPPATDDFVVRELAVHATDDYRENRRRLDRLYALQSFALLAFGVEVVALLVNLAAE
jgi:hypothetical protein